MLAMGHYCRIGYRAPVINGAGVELYFDDLETAKQFYGDTLHLEILDEQIGHYAKFGADSNFVCLERKRSESYPSLDKAVLFFEVPDVSAVMDAIGKDRIVHSARRTVLADPHGL
jgi:predicted enzyme related to lactoylglutathione lyase